MDSRGPSSKEVLLDAVAQKLGENAIDTIKPTRAIPTNLKNGPADIVVGLNAECPRWVPGSVVKWAAWRAGFDSQQDANHAAEQLAIAAEHWNRANIGVTFQWVPLAKDATFVVCHGGAMGSVLASAFFPNSNDLNYLFICSAAFRRGWRNNMWNVFLHELGHVLGLRHEFAIEKEGESATELGPRNEMSVMNYRPEPPQLQQPDIESTKLFYSLREDDQRNLPKVGLTEVVDYTPR
ncbi:hypothetical protein FNYG_08173 [Fusarium nygamai]|uniref:Peptidase metallopeptidase domain-containing protein n=1 Tax=Gibberella nygamai TaxID=42673 RepID=A0A2K0W881_GIBNY|nr:hypothetical protein FNYG_08173 [Fusarium nygamai]